MAPTIVLHVPGHIFLKLESRKIFKSTHKARFSFHAFFIILRYSFVQQFLFPFDTRLDFFLSTYPVLSSQFPGILEK